MAKREGGRGREGEEEGEKREGGRVREREGAGEKREGGRVREREGEGEKREGGRGSEWRERVSEKEREILSGLHWLSQKPLFRAVPRTPVWPRIYGLCFLVQLSLSVSLSH